VSSNSLHALSHRALITSLLSWRSWNTHCGKTGNLSPLAKWTSCGIGLQSRSGKTHWNATRARKQTGQDLSLHLFILHPSFLNQGRIYKAQENWFQKTDVLPNEGWHDTLTPSIGQMQQERKTIDYIM
jgi:hypothetical protein